MRTHAYSPLLEKYLESSIGLGDAPRLTAVRLLIRLTSSVPGLRLATHTRVFQFTSGIEPACDGSVDDGLALLFQQGDEPLLAVM